MKTQDKSQEKINIGFRSDTFNSTELRIQEIEPYMTRIAEGLQEAGLSADQVEFHSLLRNPRAELLKLKSESFQQIAAAMKSLEALDFKEMKSLIEAATTAGKIGNCYSFHLYYILADGKAIINQPALEELTESCQIYAETPDEIERYRGAKALADALNFITSKHDFFGVQRPWVSDSVPEAGAIVCRVLKTQFTKDRYQEYVVNPDMIKG